MVPAILAPGKCVEVKVDTKTVLASPLDSLEEVPAWGHEQRTYAQGKGHARPRDLLKEWLTVPSLNGPVTNGDADMVEASTGNLCEVLFGLTAGEYRLHNECKTRLL